MPTINFNVSSVEESTSSTTEIRNDIRVLTRTIAALADGQPGG